MSYQPRHAAPDDAAGPAPDDATANGPVQDVLILGRVADLRVLVSRSVAEANRQLALLAGYEPGALPT